jgi:3-hydroxymyristoyl/3-hydroxydecanoyl-(acyl carrier protein) dehydratase
MNLPTILAVDASQPDTVVLQLEIVPDMTAFVGHFPGNPILPGVVQVDWAIRLGVLHLGVAQPVARDFQVKFCQTICPSEQISLTLKRDYVKGRLLFSYTSGDTMKASGKIMLGQGA